MSRQEAGRMGGLATARSRGREFYEDIGRRGGESTARSHGKDFYEEIGRMGGRARWEDDDDDRGRR
jgi:uncharacterized protein